MDALDLGPVEDPGAAVEPAAAGHHAARAHPPSLPAPGQPARRQREGQHRQRREPPRADQRRQQPGEHGGADRPPENRQAQGAAVGRPQRVGPRVEVRGGNRHPGQPAQVVPGHHGGDALGLRHPSLDHAEAGGLDEHRRVAHRAAHQGLVDPHELHLAERDLDAPPGQQAPGGDQALAVPHQAVAVVAEQGVADAEEPGGGEGEEQGRQHHPGAHGPGELPGVVAAEAAEALEDDGGEQGDDAGGAPGEAVGDHLGGTVLHEHVPRRLLGGTHRPAGQGLQPLAQRPGLGHGHRRQQPLGAGAAGGLDAKLDEAGHLVEDVLDQLDVLDAGRVDAAGLPVQQAALDLEAAVVDAVAQGGPVDGGAAGGQGEEGEEGRQLGGGHPGALAADDQGDQQGPGVPGRAPGRRQQVDQQAGRPQGAPALLGALAARGRLRRRHRRPCGSARREGPRPARRRGPGCCRRRACPRR